MERIVSSCEHHLRSELLIDLWSRDRPNSTKITRSLDGPLRPSKRALWDVSDGRTRADRANILCAGSDLAYGLVMPLRDDACFATVGHAWDDPARDFPQCRDDLILLRLAKANRARQTQSLPRQAVGDRHRYRVL
jgi:hypothetical protein